jgi:hypothetical protein
VLVVVLVLENPDRFAIRLTEQISCSIGLFAVTESQCTEDEHDDEDEDESKFRNLASVICGICEICGYLLSSVFGLNNLPCKAIG